MAHPKIVNLPTAGFAGRPLSGPESRKSGLISLLLAKIALYSALSHTETWLSKAVRWQPGREGSFAHTFPEEPTGELNYGVT
jgi:hypothetical protein